MKTGILPFLGFAALAILPARAGKLERFEISVAPGGRPAAVFAYIFDDREETFRVAVRSAEEKDKDSGLGDACSEAKAFAGVNGGFSDFQGQPLGMVIAGGKKSGKIELNSALTSGLVVCEGQALSLRHAKDYDFSAERATQLIQTGPFLVEGGKAAEGLQNKRYSRRSVVLTDGGHKWALAYIPSATLAGLAKALVEPGIFKPFTPRAALNLDGGESSAFWTLRPGGYEFYLKEIGKPHDFLLVVPRPAGAPKAAAK